MPSFDSATKQTHFNGLLDRKPFILTVDRNRHAKGYFVDVKFLS